MNDQEGGIIDETIHASVVRLPAGGVALLGSAGSGKSALMLKLCRLYQGQLVADDRALLAVQSGQLHAAAPQSLQGLLEVRGLGVVCLPFQPSSAIDLVVELVPQKQVPRLPQDRYFTFENVQIPLLRLHAHDTATPETIIVALSTLAHTGFAQAGIYTPNNDGEV